MGCEEERRGAMLTWTALQSLVMKLLCSVQFQWFRRMSVMRYSLAQAGVPLRALYEHMKEPTFESRAHCWNGGR